MYQVLLTTSGIGSRLCETTKYMNKSLVRVGNLPAISRIIDKYPVDVEFVVTLGYYGQQVRDFLELAYPDRLFNFVTVDNYDGPGSSLVYSLLRAKEKITGPFIFHACDTIVEDTIPEPFVNWLGYYQNGDSSKYASLKLHSNKVVGVCEKGESNFDALYIGLSGIYDWQEYFAQLQLIYEANSNNQQLSDIHVLQKLIKDNREFISKKFNKWLDIGNIESLRKARNHYNENSEILDKSNESIYIFDDYVIKFFSDESIVSGRVKRAEILKGLVPNIIDSRKNFYKYEFANGTLLSKVATTKNIRKLLKWAKTNLWDHKIAKDKQFTDACTQFYLEKTKARINAFLLKSNIIDKVDIINGCEVPSVADMLDQIPLEELNQGEPCRFHGDFILDNILYDKEKFTLLDWRHEFGGLLYGDMYYDLAKLNHNLLFSHEFVSKGAYSILVGEEISIDISVKYSLLYAQKELYKFVKENGWDINKINLLTPIIWLNMSPLHERPLDLFLFYLGKFALFHILRENNEK